jgi:pyruvate kinase
MTRQTNIIATLGPASHNEEILKRMIPYIDMVRLNFSWGTHQDMESLINLVRKVSKNHDKKISIIQDLSGPRVQGEQGHHFKGGAVEVITEKDKIDLLFGIAHGVDYVAMSYVGSKEDIFALKNVMKESGAQIPIIAKIERKEAVDAIDEIIASSDGIMIARGDLGQAFPIEEVPFLERKILNLCAKENKFVIVATEMLLSMVTKDRPTRAEVTDVAYAVTGYASAVMVSEETAQGDHPDKVVEVLDKIVRYAESHRTVY